jgi:cytochrome P450 monooxygenase
VLFANVDVSASVLSTTMTNLAANPSIQTELRSEISKWKSQDEGGFSKYLTNSGTLLHRVTMESMRLSPAFCKSAQDPSNPRNTSMTLLTTR